MSPLPSVAVHLGPFQGMRFLTRATEWDHHYLYHATDAFPTADGIYQCRHGASSAIFATASAGATVQGSVFFHTTVGVENDVAVIAGEIWRREAAGGYAKDVTTANLTTASLTLNSTGRVYLTIFNNTVVVSDGTNTPFTWDGTAGAGGLTKLTNAPVAYGPPTTYYAKLFFVKNTDRDTIVWSEENAANTGYEAAGYNNTWQLTQSGSGPLHRILGRNDALYYWRKQSIGTIRGAVSTDFTAAGVHDDVSRQVGTTAPLSVVEYEGYIWFVDQFGRPFRLPPGGIPEPIWEQVGALFLSGGSDVASGGRALDLTPTDIALTLAAPFHHYRAVVFAWTPNGQSGYTHFYAFSSQSGQALCRLTTAAAAGVTGLFTPTHMGWAHDPINLTPTLTIGGSSAVSAVPGIVFMIQTGLGYHTSVNPTFLTGPIAAPDGAELHLDTLATTITLGPGTPSTVLVSAKASVIDFRQIGATPSALAGTAILSATSGVPSERMATWGLRREGRWFQFQVSAENSGTGFPGLAGVDVQGWVVPRHPGITT